MQQASRWVAAAGAFAALAVVHLLAEHPLVREGSWTLLATGACLAVLAGLRMHRPPSPRPWQLLAVGFGLLTAGNVVTLPLWPHPGWLHATSLGLELLAFPLIGLAAWGMVRRQRPEGDREAAVDGAIVLVAISTVLAGTVFTPEAMAVTSVVGRTLLVVAPLVLAAVTTAALRLLFVGERVASTYLLVSAPALSLVGHILRTHAQSAGTYTRGSWEDLFIAAAYATAALAALHPSMGHLTRPQPDAGGRLTLSRLTILGASLLTPPVTMLLRGRATVAPLAASVLVSTLVLLRLWRLVVDREAVRDEMREQALHDALTGLPNRTELLRRLQHALRRGAPPGAVTAVVFIDLDGFKQVNDDYGHRTGDDLLVAVAARLSELSRGDDLIGRLAGDEFVLVCDGVDEAHVGVIADRVLAAFAEPFRLPAADVLLGASVGVAVQQTGSRSAEQLLSEADAAMYLAKQGGGRTVERFGDALGEQLERRRRLELDLAGAATRGELGLVYQPVIDLADPGPGVEGAVVGVEALLRWTHPVLGRIDPDEVIPVADTSGLIVPVGRWVVEEACQQLARWRAEGLLPPGFRMFVNVSPRQLLNADLPADLLALCRATGTAVAELVVEVTETAVLDDQGEALRTLRALQRSGFAIALDDFGTGYSSLTHLKRLPLDLIKIDATFVEDLARSRDDQAIVAALVGIASQLGARVVGEGVETPEQRDVLRALGCDFAQGRHLGRPASAEGVPLGRAQPRTAGRVGAGGSPRLPTT